MDKRIQDIIDISKKKIGIDNYYLKRHSLSRVVTIFKETEYILCMEWFPKHITELFDDDSNPEGAVVIDMNLTTRRLENAIFVMGITYANDGVTFEKPDAKTIIKWIEQETGLMYGMQFQIHHEREGEFDFSACFNGIVVSPSGFINVKVNEEGKLTSYSIHGQFPTTEMVKEETYSLTFEKVKHVAKEQLRLVEFPVFDLEKVVPVYAVEEIYVTNDGESMKPFDFIADGRPFLFINKMIQWNEPLNTPFERKEINWCENVSVEQAFSCEPSPNSFPIPKEEQEKCELAVKTFMQQEYPNDTGKWILKSLHREKGYIHAIVREAIQDTRVFQRKLMIIIDTESFEAQNYLDNKPMLEIYEQFQAPDKVKIKKDEAFEKLKNLYELKPVYVYDIEQKQYMLCAKIDCHHGVNAATGEVILLSDL